MFDDWTDGVVENFIFSKIDEILKEKLIINLNKISEFHSKKFQE